MQEFAFGADAAPDADSGAGALSQYRKLTWSGCPILPRSLRRVGDFDCGRWRSPTLPAQPWKSDPRTPNRCRVHNRGRAALQGRVRTQKEEGALAPARRCESEVEGPLPLHPELQNHYAAALTSLVCSALNSRYLVPSLVIFRCARASSPLRKKLPTLPSIRLNAFNLRSSFS
jgi:hypothetical protein